MSAYKKVVEVLPLGYVDGRVILKLECGHAKQVVAARSKDKKYICRQCAIAAPDADVRDDLIAELRKKIARLEGSGATPKRSAKRKQIAAVPSRPGKDDTTICKCRICQKEGFAREFGWRFRKGDNKWVAQSSCFSCRINDLRRKHGSTSEYKVAT